MSRVPIRLRLTAVFVLAMAAILTATGLFLYYRLASSLDGTIDDALRSRADDVAALVRRSDQGLADGGALRDRDQSFAQVLTPAGAVVDASPGLGDGPLLTAAERARASRRPQFIEQARSPAGEDDPFRILAAPVDAQGSRLLIVVGTSLEGREDALGGLLFQLLLGGPVALALAALLAYWLGAAALRPVEEMRREAADIGAASPGTRLPVSPAGDEISRLGSTLNEMLARLEAALARERAFVADASHELRTPLALLRAELELALRRERTPAELAQAVRSAAEEAERLGQLADDLLLLARGDQGELAVRKEPLAAEPVLRRVASRFGLRAASAGRDVRVDSGPVPVFAADRLRLEQVLGNLVDNALRHGSGDVTLTARAAGESVELHVLDEGDGFPAGFAEQAFQRFSRADDARAGDGSGLGLAIALTIARAHGGSAGLRNRHRGGADVWISLPL